MHLPKTVAAVAAGTLVAGVLSATAWAAPAVVDRAPVRVLDVDGVDNLAVGPDGLTYLARWDDGIVAYAADASGDDDPVKVLEGEATGLSQASALAFDSAGRLYVADTGNKSIKVYAAGASGDTAPIRTITRAPSPFVGVRGISIDPSDNLYVVDAGMQSVSVYAPGADGAATPVRVIQGAQTGLSIPNDVGFGRNGDVYVSVDSVGIRVFAANAQGDVAPKRTIERAGVPLGSIGQFAIDSSDNVYVVDNSDDGVLVFDGDAGGPVEPTVVLSGPSTGIDEPWSLALDADRNVLVHSWEGGGVSTFAPLVPFTRPTAVTDLKVAGDVKAESRTVSWKAPSDDGGAAVTYQVSVSHGGATLLNTTTTGTSLKVTRAQLRTDAHTVTVIASNRIGAADSVTASFTVARIEPTALRSAPSAVRSVKVKGAAGAAKRFVSWQKPVRDGGAKITKYRVVVKKGKKVLSTKAIKAAKRALVLKRSALGSGTHTVLVTAKNSKGHGKAGKKRFTVKQ